MNKKVEVALSPQTIRTVLLIAVGIFFIWKLSDIFILLITAVMVASALNPAVKWLNKKLPLALSAALIVIALILPLVYVVGAVIPDFISQFPAIIDRVTSALSGANFLPPYLRQLDFSQYFQNGSSYIFESTKIISNFFIQAITFIFLVFYLLIDGESLRKLVALSIKKENRKKVEKLADDLGRISGQYIRGNLLISLICASVTFIGLMLIGVPYALPLAIFAGVMDLLPLIGSTIGAVPAVIIAFTISPVAGLLTIALFGVYQAVENDILAPSIYNKVLNLLPFLSFIVVIIGSIIFGIAGAFLALPIAAGIPTIIKHLEKQK
jgi:predicted PurR-regulated permease PerM